MTVASDLCRSAGAPPQNIPDLGGSISRKKSRAFSPNEIIPNRLTNEPNFAVACPIHLLTQRLQNLELKTRRGLVITIFTRRRVPAYFFSYIGQIEITSPLRVFSSRFRGRWVSRCMRHATAKFGSLVYRFGMISVGLHAHDFF